MHVAQFGKVWIFHTHLTRFTSECRLIPPPYSSRAAGAQDPHERSAKEEETCLKRVMLFSEYYFPRQESSIGGQASMEIYPSKIIRKKNLRKNPVQKRKAALEISLLRCYCRFFLQERDTEDRGKSLISEKFKTFLSTVPRKLELLAANGCGLVERWSRQVGRF